MNTNMMVFKKRCIFVLYTKVASILEGLITSCHRLFQIYTILADYDVQLDVLKGYLSGCDSAVSPIVPWHYRNWDKYRAPDGKRSEKHCLDPNTRLVLGSFSDN